jgi:hypothetical protein
MRSDEGRTRASHRTGRVLALATILLAGVTSGVLADAAAPPQLGVTPPAAAAPSDACLDDLGNETACDFGLEPVQLPTGRLIGEFELGLMHRDPGSSRPSVSPRDFATGDFLGGCVPEQERCLLDEKIRVGSPDAGESPDEYFLYENASPVAPFPTSGPLRAAPSGDMAIEKADLDGDGRHDLVHAAECASANGPTGEICLSLYRPALNTFTPWQRTGLTLDSGLAPIRLAAGNTAQSTTTVTGASFEAAPDGVGMYATFTTARPHALRPGQAVRFDANEAWLLNESLCVPGEDGGTTCAGVFGEQLQAVERVSGDRRSFAVRIGSLLNAAPDGACPDGFRCLPDGTLEPLDWPAEGCDDGCEVDVTGTGPGLAVAFAAPGGTAQLAAFTVRPQADVPFRLGDVAGLGGLDGPRKALALAVGDLDGGLPDEIVAVFASRCGQDPCAQLRIYRWNDSRQLVLVRSQRLPSVAVQEFNRQGQTQSIDVAIGNLDDSDGGNAEGGDLLVGWVKSQAACLTDPCAGQEYVVLDVTPRYGVVKVAERVLQEADQASLVDRTMIRVATGDLDGDGLDDPVVARTTFGDDDRAPIVVETFGSAGGTGSWSSGDRRAVGAQGSGQIDLAVGQLGRVTEPERVGMPNAANPDVLLSWTCNSALTCGAPTTGSAVAVKAFGAVVEGGSLALEAPAGAPPALTPAAIGPLGTWSVANERTYAAATLADLDADSETLGPPVTYLTVGQVQPMLVVKSPPVHFDAFDGGSDGKVDGFISYNDTDDVNGCFALNKADDCGTSSEYSTVTSIDTAVSGSYSNSWGISGSVTANAWWGSQIKDPDTDEVICRDPVCAGLAVKVKTEYQGQQEDSAKAGKSFTYRAARTTGAGADAAFAVVQTTKTLEWPVYPGVSPFGAGLEPGRYLRVDSPAETRFQWIDANDPELSARWWQSTVPTNVLSYARNEQQLAVDTRGVSEVEAQGTRRLRIHTRGNHGWVCELADFKAPDGDRELQPPGYLTDYPCATGQVPVQLSGLTGVGSRFNGSYLVTQVLGPDDLLAERVAGDVPSGTWKAGDMTDTNCAGCPLGSLRRTPGRFLDQDVFVSRNSSFDNSVEVTDEEEFNASAAWSIDTGLDVEVRLAGSFLGKAGTGLNINVGGNYKRAETASRTVQATSGTTFGVKIGSNLKSSSGYFVRPYLAADPVTKAMTLDWTADCRTNCTEGIWGDVYRRNVDLAFSLPRLMTPFRDPNNSPYDLANLLRSPDFATWDCAVDNDLSTTVCEPIAAAEPGEPMTLSTYVHNYSLRPHVSTRPATVRYFVGDPARGGYQVTEASQTRTAAGAPPECSGFAFCIPARGEAFVTQRWTPPQGLAGRGTPDAPIAIHGVIVPPRGTTEIHPWTGPADLAACKATYPLLDSLHSEYYDPTDVFEDRLSRCPTSNNQGFFLQRFAGNPARATDLSVRPAGVTPSKDGSSVNVRVRSSRALTGQRVEVRMWSCSRTASCSPAVLPLPNNASLAQGLAAVRRLTVGAGGSATLRLPLGLRKGTRQLTVQVVPLDMWERPGGPGVGAAGQLGNNVVTVPVTVR